MAIHSTLVLMLGKFRGRRTLVQTERPSKETGVRLSVDLAHGTAFGGKRPNVRGQDRGSESPINWKTDFLTRHIRHHPGLPAGDRHLLWVSRRKPWATSGVGVALSGTRPLRPFRTGTAPFGTTFPSAGRQGLRGSFRHFRACGPGDLHLKHFPGWSYLLTDGETSLPLWVVLRSQGMADSYDHQFHLTPGLYVFTLGSLFLLSLFSIINTPTDISRSWGIGVCGPHLTSGDCA